MNDDPTPGAPQRGGTDPLAGQDPRSPDLGGSDPAPSGDPIAASDPLDDTQRVDVPRYAPTPDPRPDARWAWASPATPAGQPTSERWYEPGPDEPSYAPPAWGQPATSETATPIATPPVQPAVRRSGPGIGIVVVATLLSAVVASGGTVFVLDQTGAFDRPAPASNIGSAQATGGTQPITINELSAVIDAAEKVGPAVVKITTGAAGPTADPFGGSLPEGVGSGFIFDANGWILTNRHVVADAETLTVELKDGRQFEGRVYGIDTLTDLAIVKVDESGLPVAALGESDGLKIGQLVVAIGSPLGMYSFSVTSGIVSGKGRDVQVENGTRITNLIQTDAAINPGNSGGPLADASGAVVGINTAVATDSSGIGFAIPIDIAKPIMAQAVAGETLSRPWIGIRFQSINQQVKKDQGLAVDDGALVTNIGGTGPAILPNSPAEKAGIREGDIVVAINGIEIDQEHPLDALLVQFKPGETVVVDVLRDGAPMSVSVTLGTRPKDL